jgi:hypothetical protein
VGGASDLVDLIQRQTSRCSDFVSETFASFFAALIGSVHIPCSVWVLWVCSAV